MRRLLLQDIMVMAEALSTLPSLDRERAALAIIDHAHRADKYRKRTGKRSAFGSGSIMDTVFILYGRKKVNVHISDYHFQRSMAVAMTAIADRQLHWMMEQKSGIPPLPHFEKDVA